MVGWPDTNFVTRCHNEWFFTRAMYRRVFRHRAVSVFWYLLPERPETDRRQLGLWEICIIWGLGISLAVYLTAGISGDI